MQNMLLSEGCVLQYDRDALSSADTGTPDGIPLLRAYQLVSEVGEDPCTGSSKRMTQGDGSSVEIHFAPIQA